MEPLQRADGLDEIALGIARYLILSDRQLPRACRPVLTYSAHFQAQQKVYSWACSLRAERHSCQKLGPELAELHERVFGFHRKG